ncbi:TPA: adhesion domain-containing protein [Photobacterium damselae]
MKHEALMIPLIVGVSLSLLGCGGEKTNTTPPSPPPPPPMPAVQSISDVMTTAEVGKRQHVPVYQYVQPKEGQLLSISNVRAVSDLSSADSCPTPDINGLELVYTPDSQGLCGYEYTITDGDNSTKARVISMASLDSVTKLTDISKSTSVGTALTTAISNPDSTNETLTVVSVLGSGSAYASGNNIVFEATAPGLARVIYTLSQEAASSPLKVGVINVTVSEAGESNSAPTTPDITAIAAPNQTITLSPNITDADSGDDPQLISVVNSQGATVRSLVQDGPVNEDYFTNKNFTFRATAPGAYTVYYTAHDHRGGYNTGKATVSVSGQVGLMAKDASFYRDQTSTAYDFTIDLRSYVTAANPSSVTYLPAEFASDSADKTPANIVMTSNNQILTYKVPANQSGTVKIKYTVKENQAQTSGTIFIAIGEALPTITTMGTTPRVGIGAEVTATSTCGTGCVQAKTTYEWLFNGTYYSDKTNIVVPEGYSGESLTLIATPYNAKGQRGVSKATTYNYPFRAASVSVNKAKAKIGESITMTVNPTYLGTPDATARVTVTAVSATNRQNQTQEVTAKVNGAANSTQPTDAAGNATFTLTDPNGKGVKTTFDASIHGHVYGSASAIFTTLTSPDVSTANFWGHMPNQISVGEDQFQRPPLASEEDGAAGVTFTENGEVWGRITKAEATTYCTNNVPTPAKLALLYNAYPSGGITTRNGWPTSAPYITQTNNDVVSLADGTQSSSTGTNTVSCHTLKPIDSTGVTIDILKEDGTYTNDKFPPSSTAMTYGALMFPGAGIRINLPDAVIPSTITVDAPTGYVKNIVGKSVELTDMVRDDYRDQIITAVGKNASGDLLGLRLKVSSTKYQNATAADYIPQPDSTGMITLKRDVTFPSRDVAWYQHGLVTAQRSSDYRATEGATPRYAAFAEIIKKRFDISNEGSSADGESGSFKTVLLYFIPAEKNVEWLRGIIVGQLTDPRHTEISIQALSDQDKPLGRWVVELPDGVRDQRNRLYRPYLIEGTTPYVTPTAARSPARSQQIITNRATLRLCPGAQGEFAGADTAITEFIGGVLPITPIAVRSNATILKYQYAAAIKGLEHTGWTAYSGYGDLISGFAHIVTTSHDTFRIGKDTMIGPTGRVTGDPLLIGWNPAGYTDAFEWATDVRYWGFPEFRNFIELEQMMDRQDEGLGDIVHIDGARLYYKCTGDPEGASWKTVDEVVAACSILITERCGPIVDALTHYSAPTIPIRTDDNIRLGNAVTVAGTPEVRVRKFPIK